MGAASYDLDAIAEALAARFQGLPTDVYGGESWTITANGSAPGTVSIPALVIELDDLSYDLSMGRGADSAVYLAYLLVSEADSSSGQKLVRRLLSSGGVATRIKDALNGQGADQSLGQLVDYAQMSGTRSIGSINYNGIGYQGAVLEIQVMLS